MYHERPDPLGFREAAMMTAPRRLAKIVHRLIVGALLIESFLVSQATVAKEAHDGFSDITHDAADVITDIRYYSANNFVGARIDGYLAPRCLLTTEATAALAQVQVVLLKQGRSLKIFDCYRPQRAVDHFVRWANNLADQHTKAEYYPFVDKAELFARGYIAARSGHSRGSTVDLTIVELDGGQELDMGTPFDFFDSRSHTDSPGITVEQRANRNQLRSLMEQYNFLSLPEEWWHFTLENEPYPDIYFNFSN